MANETDGIPVRAGLIGAGIKHSLSPALHMAEGAALGIDYRYELIDLDDVAAGSSALPAVLDRIKKDGFAGCNVTYPLKQAVIPLLDRLDRQAEAIGAVNTVRIAPDGGKVGYNTDWQGFSENLRHGLGGRPIGRVVLVGAGGAGAAAAYALGEAGAMALTIVDTDDDRAEALALRLRRQGFMVEADRLDAIGTHLATADGVVHATPTGMARYPGMPFSSALLRRELWVAEIVYVPLETELVRAARAHGCRVIDGGGMVVRQAARALEIFTGVRPDEARMMRHFMELVPAQADWPGAGGVSM